MPRTARSRLEEDLNDKLSLEDVVAGAAETIEAEEKQLLSRLAKKYRDQEAGERMPGRRVKGQKTIWTYHDMVERFDIVDFTPEETIPLSWNGVKVQAYAGIEMHVPKPFYDLYNKHRREAASQKAPPGISILVGYDGFQES